jgi:Protein of unknown function (DUF3106)
MRGTTSHLSGILLLGAALAAAGQSEKSSSQAAPPRPPMPARWYQTVTNGVTLTNLTPVAYFRGLLGMTPAERERMLAGQPATRRIQVLAKVREYEALPREVREERMRQTDIHWYLLNLLRLEPAQRKEQLKEISPLYQPMLLAQLAQWDRLPAAIRQALLEKESFLSKYVQWQDHSPAGQEEIVSHLPAELQAEWAQELNRWQALPERRREELSQAFRQFFYSSGEERKETIQALSETERRQMEQTLQSYADLPPSLQRLCVESFSKFAVMSAEDRNQFLQNAAKWEAMTPRERELWRTLVNRLPPMPPGYYQSKTPPLPPLPPGMPPPPGWPPPSAAGQPGVTNMAKAPTSS